MHLSSNLFIVFIIFTTFTGLIFGDEFESDSQLTLYIYHAFDFGTDVSFTQRGSINVHSLKAQDVSYRDTSSFSSSDAAKLRKLSQHDGLYRIMISTRPTPDGNASISTFMKACSLYESGLSDRIVISLDQNGNLMGVSLTSSQPQCTGRLEMDKTQFNTSISLLQMVNGPAPDTQTYILRMEQEKAEKAKGEQADNRSFFSKYWMYIVPVVIFLLISGASSPDTGNR